MKKHSHPKRLACFLLSAMMVLGLVTVPEATIEAAENSTYVTSDSLLNLDSQAPAGLATAKNPYGYDEGIAFPLSIGHEIISLSSCNVKDDNDVSKTTLNGSSINDLENFVKNPSEKGSSYNFSMPNGNAWNWVQAVAFDSNKDSAKDDKVLFIGVNEDKDVYAWVWDCSAFKCSSPLYIGDMDWLSNSYEQFASTSLFDVAAGDFDGDGIDSLFVYAPLDLEKNSSSPGCVLYELSYDGSTLSKKGDCNHLLMEQYITDQNNKTYTDSSSTKDTCRDKLVVSMQVADFNGDNIDDLAVLSYSQYRKSGANTAYYSPQLKVCYGSKNTALTDIKPKSFTVAASSGDTLTFPVAASLAAGDYNNDGYDDLYVVGAKATTTKSADISKISVSDEQWYLHRFIAEYDGGEKSVILKDKLSTAIESNAFFVSGFYTPDEKHKDYYYGKTMAVGVAISGQAGAEMLFISGSLYDVSNETPILKTTGKYFQSSDSGATDGWNSNAITNTFMQSVIVGNFDNNPAGREQVVFTVGLKSSGEDDYYYKAGFLSGENFADTEYSDGSTCYGIAKEYNCTDLDKTSYILSDIGDNMDECLNCLLIAVDYDDDLVEAKYLGVDYVYTDPTVIAVLQAAPYFSGVSPSGTTTYSFEHSCSYSDSDTDSANLSAGITASLSIPLTTTLSSSVGLKGGVSQTYTDTLTTTYTDIFSAEKYNAVVVNRTPILIYRFDVKCKDSNGNLNWTGEPQLDYFEMQAPVNNKLRVDEYNAFAQKYNQKLKDDNVQDCTQLQEINKTDNWLDGNEGNPYLYNDKPWATLDIDAIEVGGSSLDTSTDGSTSVSLSDTNSQSYSFSWNIGFYSKVSLTAGTKGNNTGLEFNGDYTHTFGTSTVTATSTKTSFTVSDLDATALLDSGMPEEVVNLYKFNWTAAIWEQNLGNSDSDGKAAPTPFLGYGVTNVSSPPLAVTDLKISDSSITENNTPQFTLSWTKPETVGYPSIDKYILYQGVTDKDGAIEYQPVLDNIDGNCTSITIDKTLDNQPLEYDKEYTYKIRSVHDLGNGKYAYSSYSNSVTAVTPHPSHTVTLTYDENAIDVNATKNGNIKVNSGDKVNDDSILKIIGEPKEGYKLINLSVANTTTGETNTIAPDEDGTITCYHKMKDDVEFIFNTKKIITEATVTFTDPVYDENDSTKPIGHVTASTSGQEFNSGGIVSGPVTFTATPEDGYSLTGWEVTVDGQVYHYPTNDKTEFTLGLVGENIDVKAMFAPSDTIWHTITIQQPDEGGSILLTYPKGTILVPDENGRFCVINNTEVRLTAQLDTGYVINSWSVKDTNNGTAIEPNGGNDKSFLLNVTRDITVGIDYRAPVKYKLTYTVEDEHQNILSTEPYFASGSAIAAGTEITFHATAADGYRIEKWTITRGSETTEEVRNDACYLTDTQEITMDTTTNVEVSFVECEQYSVNVRSSGKGNVSMIRGASKLNNGDTVDYMANILLVAKPHRGWKLSNLDGWTDHGDGTFSKLIANIKEEQALSVAFEEIPSTDNDNSDKDNKDDSDNKNDTPTQPGKDNNPTTPDDSNKPSTGDNNNDNSSNTGNDNSQNTNQNNNTTSGNNNNGSSQKKPGSTSKTDTKATLKTGDAFSILPVIGLLAAAIVIFIILRKKKK